MPGRRKVLSRSANISLPMIFTSDTKAATWIRFRTSWNTICSRYAVDSDLTTPVADRRLRNTLVEFDRTYRSLVQDRHEWA